jgi:tetratricopeptide (TPR) repeat protein
VLVKFLSKITVAFMFASLLGSAAWGQAKNWKDRAEYDLFEAARTATDPNKKLEALNAWQQKYPATDYEEERLLMFTQTYQQLKNAPKMWESAEALLKKNPKNVEGLYHLTTLTVTMEDVPKSPEKMATGEKAAKALLDSVSTLQKPANLSDADFKKQVDHLTLVANTTLGWAAMNRKNYAEAEATFRKILETNPNNAQVSYWLGTVMIAQRVPEKQIQAFYHFARAGHYSGEGALLPAGRKEVAAYLQKIYVSYHGDESGLSDLIAMAQKSPVPPPNLEIKSKEQVEYEKEEKFRKENPQLALWLSIKKLLTAADGEQYFAGNMKGTKVENWRGYLVSQTPADRPKTLVLALSDRDTREVTVNLDTPFRYAAPRGTPLRFSGVPTSFTKEPFMVTMEAQQDQVDGWPPPPSRKPAR